MTDNMDTNIDTPSSVAVASPAEESHSLEPALRDRLDTLRKTFEQMIRDDLQGKAGCELNPALRLACNSFLQILSAKEVDKKAGGPTISMNAVNTLQALSAAVRVG